MSLWNRLFPKPSIPASREIDAESAQIWEDFKNTDLPICCKAMRALIKRGITTMTCQFYKKDDVIKSVDVKVQYCCGCGRKLI